MKVSVIIPSYNRYDYVQKSILSVMKQTVDTEIIVIDDCSTDDRYLTLAERYPNIIIKHLPINSRKKYGVEAAQGSVRNEGLSHVTGDWIAFLDDDDEWLDENKLVIQIEMMQKYNCEMSSTNMKYWSNSSNTFNLYHPSSFTIGTELESDIHLFTCDDIESVNYINNSSVVISKKVVDKVGLFNVVDYEDYDYWKRALMYTNCLYVHKPLVLYSMQNTKYYKCSS
jgi:teichuronic acid biosynthesis glycosyltransferase TuaG